MNNLYKEIDDYIDALEQKSYTEFAGKIKDAKLSGCMASEILGLVSLELKDYSRFLSEKDEVLIQTVVELLDKINAWFKLY